MVQVSSSDIYTFFFRFEKRNITSEGDESNMIAQEIVMDL